MPLPHGWTGKENNVKLWIYISSGYMAFLMLFCFYLLYRVSTLERLTLAMRANAAERTEVLKMHADTTDNMAEALQRIVNILRIQYGIEEEESD